MCASEASTPWKGSGTTPPGTGRRSSMFSGHSSGTAPELILLIPRRLPGEDVLAALRAATRLVARSDVVLDLRGADLRNCDLSGLSKSQILLDGADVRDAQLPG